ncbi:cytochrome-ba3 oxidase subunit [Natronobacterium texcoconense]|uniref:DUF8131 domain-containing protein n=1 Tax=Natronobacterium texcoconense TaxID=1095778 RepID=A0A1H1HKQ9_NATTX|nr:cytochrome-ba3 oxidase subunit [Natronobacterium texcoconense]SDR25909.1 hypothetical protein SAMN04489842_2833 [Natronobacterium texcoconense]
MAFESLTPRRALIVGLLALLPVSWYGLAGSLSAGVVSAINVLIILTCLFIAFTPVEGHHAHGSDGSSS